MPPSAFEHWYLAQAPYEAGDYERAIEVASEGLADYPDHPLLHYNLACFCSMAGRGDEATEHLRKAFEGDARTRGWASEDSDLDEIRHRPDFPAS
jgi:adenylate cyclase